MNPAAVSERIVAGWTVSINAKFYVRKSKLAYIQEIIFLLKKKGTTPQSRPETAIFPMHYCLEWLRHESSQGFFFGA